jgi:DNA-binding NarL/FixJ family response regulator
VSIRVLVAEDSVLFREGLLRLLTEAGHTIAAAVADATSLPAAVDTYQPDLALIDVRMPPGMTDDGARAARQLRLSHPGLPLVLLSQHVETRHLIHLVATGSFGYLLKDRVLAVDDFLDALQRVAAGGTALDPVIVQALVTPTRADDPLRSLTTREREILEVAAQGRSNTAISAQLFITERTVETHMRSIFRKLQIDESTHHHRRVLAVLTYLTHQPTPSPHPGGL